MRRIRFLAAGLTSLLCAATVGVATGVLAGTAAAANPPGPMLTGFNQQTLAANDDGSTGAISLPFPIDFFGNTYSTVYVNNNGNITFNAPLATYTPSALSTFGSPIVAPFWADVDTAVAGSAVAAYGTGTVDGHQAFGVTWNGVDCYATTGGGLNYFQVLLVDRSDVAPGDFDIEYNYNQVKWDSGQASGGDATCQHGTAAEVGYSNGSSQVLTLAGSLQDGAFLDGGPDSLKAGSQNSSTPGRYIFPIRNGVGGSTISGQVTDSATPANPVAGAVVVACGTGAAATICYRGNTGGTGDYELLGVPAGQYTLTVSPPTGSSLNEGTAGPFTVSGSAVTENVALHGPTPPPNNTVVQGIGTSVVGGVQVPVVNWDEAAPFSTHACPGGTVTVTVTATNSNTDETQTVPNPPVHLTEGPAGTFSGSLPPVYPLHGAGTVTITIANCPNPAQDGQVTFSIYIDPSGTVTDLAGHPVAGATVTLLASDSLHGSYTPVPNGSAEMSPGNRRNPDTTRSNGTFGWDTVPGYYEVEAAFPGCGTATSQPFQVPPPKTNLVIALPCTLGTTVGPSGVNGYWEVASDGGVFAFGGAHFYGSMGGHRLNAPVVGIAAAPDGRGYWEVASDGGVFAFGSARFYGSNGGRHLNAPVVGIAASRDGGGYWEVASDGGVFAFGDAHFYGSAGGQHLNAPVVGMAATPDGGGYWEVASDGGVFTHGDAHFYGSTGGRHINAPIVALVSTPNGLGYWELASDGGVFTFGSASFFGSEGGHHLNAPIVG